MNFLPSAFLAVTLAGCADCAGLWSIPEPRAFVDDSKTYWFQECYCPQCGEGMFQLTPYYEADHER